MISLNKQQQEAAQALEGAVMVLAGAGSGKTRVLTARIANLIDSGVLPQNILAITFTNKAANEMKERIASVCDCGGMTVCTIHSMCAKILRAEAKLLGYKNGFTIYTDTDSEKVVKRLCKEGAEEKSKEKILRYLSQAKNAGIDPRDFIKEANIDAEEDGESVAKVMTEYQNTLKQSNAMDFDDLLYNVFLLFSTQPSVLQKYRNTFKYINIDEFQDTNTVQYDIFKMLAGENGNIFVVGDDDQSIYGWRGANADNMQKFKRDFKDVKVFYLEQNYRSTKKILNVANKLISKNEDRFLKTLWTENTDGVRVETFCATGEGEEARFALQQINALVGRGYNYGDFAILMRVNALSRTFEQECMSYGIPFKVFGGFKFFERKEVKDALAYLRLAVNPYDDEAFVRAINEPKRGIGDATISKLRGVAAAKNTSLLLALNGIENSNVFNRGTTIKLTNFFDIVVGLANMSKTDSLPKVVATLLNMSGLVGQYSNDDDNARLQNLNELVAASNEFSTANPQATLSDFLESVSLKSDTDDMEQNGYVSIATIHAAKGLEWKVVFVVGLDDGIFPSTRAILSLPQMQEERRLMYVAVTRARERLFITRAQSRFLYGERKYMPPSKFYTEIIDAPPREQRYDDDGVPLYDRKETARISSAREVNPPKQVVSGQYKTGQKVLHKVYGEGMIISVNGGNADVVFASVGKKTLALKYAPLTIIG